MSELHTYRITLPCNDGVVDVRAFTAADAVEQWRQDASVVRRRMVKIEPLPDSPERAPRREWATIPVGANPEPSEGTGRAFTPSDRAEALEAALRERTAERDSLERRLAGREAALDGNRLDRERLATSLKETREECDRLRSEYERTLAFRSERFDEIAKVVWPRYRAPDTYALKDLVEAVRKMGAERDNLMVGCQKLYARERVLLADRASLVRAITGWPADLPIPYEQDVSPAIDEARSTREQRDALQKRIDAAKARIHAHPWNAAPSAFQDRLLAILEGREP